MYVSDFASYKPTYLPLDDPSDFAFYFDTSGRRSCYLAPERFYTASENPDISAKKSKLAAEDGEGRRDGKVTEAMDCFSAGCVIAELFLEGKPLFTLSELFKYREGELKVDAQLGAVEDDGVKVSLSRFCAEYVPHCGVGFDQANDFHRPFDKTDFRHAPPHFQRIGLPGVFLLFPPQLRVFG